LPEPFRNQKCNEQLLNYKPYRMTQIRSEGWEVAICVYGSPNA
jgi:hypothetical protein